MLLAFFNEKSPQVEVDGSPFASQLETSPDLSAASSMVLRCHPGAADPVPGVRYGQHLLKDGLRGRGISEHKVLLGLQEGRGAARRRGARGGPVAAGRAVSLCTPGPGRSVTGANLGTWMHAA